MRKKELKTFLKRLSFSAIFLGFILALSLTSASAQTQSAAAAQQIRCSIEIESDQLSAQKPANVTVRIENISGNDLKFWAGYTFYLRNLSRAAQQHKRPIVGDEFWGPAAMVSQKGKLELLPNGLEDFKKIDERRYVSRNEQVNLGRGATIKIEVDLRRLRWADRMHSFWPSMNLFQLVKGGEYELVFEVDGTEVQARSNSVQLSVVQSGP